eukprot:gnl/TRDRNA2_/TRDRNA2_202600_c0_seq1.p1 gnl/TRDRNA2_/TRDRNA2_202600_c0~~gnl/TRDRNA2_/TRDRNA2_202600_c0_seq1.p1  ORF type:complete len:280 (+),score=47.93 gnl/TRDRNA2_/TRDRNA2_202600_c0_seq1:50-889(+)
MCSTIVFTLFAFIDKPEALASKEEWAIIPVEPPEKPGVVHTKLWDGTMIMPAAYYETVKEVLKASAEKGSALDLGPGAGYSTKVLHELGYAHVDAVNPDGYAWRRYGYASKLDGVVFHELSDDMFFQAHRQTRYDAIIIGYTVTNEKARHIGSEHLKKNGRMVVPLEEGLLFGDNRTIEIAAYQLETNAHLQQLFRNFTFYWPRDDTRKATTLKNSFASCSQFTEKSTTFSVKTSQELVVVISAASLTGFIAGMAVTIRLLSCFAWDLVQHFVDGPYCH